LQYIPKVRHTRRIMFTGIITHLGEVAEKTGDSLTIKVPEEFLVNVTLGSSISVSGVCLTVTKLTSDSFRIEYMPETARKTVIGSLELGSLVNLERSATPTTFLDGHIVYGHVDTQAKISQIKEEGNSKIFTFELEKSFLELMVSKGSVAVNGISLTVIEVGDSYFTTGIIPHTLEKTMLHKSVVNDLVNIEIDVIGKYIKKFINL